MRTFENGAPMRCETGQQQEEPAHLSIHIPRKDFSVNGRTVHVLTDLRFEVRRGEFVSLLGPSGCGKTTLLRMIAGLERADEGHISLDGHAINGPGPDRGIVFQESRLFPWLTVEQNVGFALPAGTSGQGAQRLINHALELVGLSKFRQAWPYQLSGGMEKRVALARALVNVPSLLLLDEPYSALDTFAKFALQAELARIHEREKMTSVLITHDLDEAIYLSDRIVVLSPAPATIRNIHPISLSRPRDRTSEAFARFRSIILEEVLRNL